MAPAIDPDIKRFVDAIGASVPFAGTEDYSAFRKIFKRQNYFALSPHLLVVKISRSPKPFWGLTKSVIDSINALDKYYVVFLDSPTTGWVFAKNEVTAQIGAEEWPLALDGDYKINSPLQDRNAFLTISEFLSKVRGEA
jgi:hypothetical protein